MKKYLCGLLVVLSLLTAATVPLNIVTLVNDNVYEVLVPKQEADYIKYEKPLPFDKLPYSERMDKYISIGSAFTLKNGFLISAAHVIPTNLVSQFTHYYVRDSKKNVYEVETIQAYASNRDFIIFSLKNHKVKSTFVFSEKNELNSKVYAIGNALGEGTVIREGLLTSKTFEDMDGKWEWLRFSAAASPGNSGGPLINGNGQVIGLILMKSENENLNYALPVKEFLKVSSEANLKTRFLYRYTNMPFTEEATIEIKQPLPASFASINNTLSNAWRIETEKLAYAVVSNNQNEIFPSGDGSLEMLYGSKTSMFPYILGRETDNKWSAFYPKDDPQTKYIENEGYLQYGWSCDILMVKLRKPNNTSVAQLLDNSELLMNLLLKAINLDRKVAGVSVRINSLGKASWSSWHKDSYGRKWLMQTWDLPYNDTRLTCFFLPLPDGFILLTDVTRTDIAIDLLTDYKLYTDFVFADYYGTFADWSTFLSSKNAEYMPAHLKNTELSFTDKEAVFGNDQFQLKYTTELMPVSSNSFLRASYKVCPVKANTEKALIAHFVSMGEDANKDNYLYFLRHSKPDSKLREGFQNYWTDLNKEIEPYNRKAYQEDGLTVINSLKGKSNNTIYSVSFCYKGEKDQRFMEDKLQKSLNALQVLEKE